MDVDLSTQMLKDNNGCRFEYSELDGHESRKNIASTTNHPFQPLTISSLAIDRKRNNRWGFEYSDVERGIMVGDLSTQELGADMDYVSLGAELDGRKSTFFADFRKLLKSTSGTHMDLEIQNFL